MTDDPSADDFRVVFTTAGSQDQAVTIAQALVERRLAACVNVFSGMCSIYRWKGKLVEEDEKLLLIKTDQRRFPAVREAIRELHTYEVPEVLALPVLDGDRAYLDWIRECLAGSDAD